MQNVLFVSSEVHPLMKTGGLGDVSGSLPVALSQLGADVRVLMPAYRDARARAGTLQTVATLQLIGAAAPVTVLEGTLPGSTVKLWMLDCPALYDRPGNPYLAPDGQNWPDNAQRFALLCRAAVEIATNRATLNWQPQVVHCHDWQTGLIPALLSREPHAPTSVFTIHNLAYQGLFPAPTMATLQLPQELWSPDALEFHNQLCFIKGGLVFADIITTVSPNYAREIQTVEFGCGLDGLLRHRSAALRGIINGIDEKEWDPAHDPALAAPFSVDAFTGKAANKRALQREFGLPLLDKQPLIGMVGRLAHQKGVDLALEALPQLLKQPMQLVVLGSGEAQYASQLQNWARRLPQQIAVRIGYDEALAHRIEAGADMFLMPSRFEPCGLNQLYSLRYGTVPIVRRVGGLVDTVVDTDVASLATRTATGFMIEREDSSAVVEAVTRAVRHYRDGATWRRIATTGMRQDHSWPSSARGYLDIYAEAIQQG
jgi:starch synthase